VDSLKKVAININKKDIQDETIMDEAGPRISSGSIEEDKNP
jgi:hypothetical protein